VYTRSNSRVTIWCHHLGVTIWGEPGLKYTDISTTVPSSNSTALSSTTASHDWSLLLQRPATVSSDDLCCLTHVHIRKHTYTRTCAQTHAHTLSLGDQSCETVVEERAVLFEEGEVVFISVYLHTVRRMVAGYMNARAKNERETDRLHVWVRKRAKETTDLQPHLVIVVM